MILNNTMVRNSDRYINLFGEITENSCKDVMDKIINITSMYDDESNKKDFIPKPIVLIINSYGGEVYAEKALVDFIKIQKYPIYTVCTGYAMSAAFSIFLAGSKRYITKNAVLMYHQLSAFNWGKLQQIKEDTEEYEALNNELVNYVLDNSNITEKTIESIHEKKKDWYIRGKEIIKLGLADKIISNLSEIE